MTINYQSGTIGYLDITFGPKWDYIPLTRSYIENFLLVRLTDKKNVSKISMAASELLENAVKYSIKEGIRLVMNKRDDTNVVDLTVSNYSSKHDAELVLALIEKLKKVNPLQFYIEKMKESVNRSDGRAGLGLARISAEGGANMEGKYFEDEGIFEIVAVFKYN